MQPTPAFLPGKSHRQRSLAVHRVAKGQTRLKQPSPHNYDLDREGNGTPLQYSCLENPMDGGTWKAAVHGSLRVEHD